MHRICFLLSLFASTISFGQSVVKEYFTAMGEKTDEVSAHYYSVGKKVVFTRGSEKVESYVDTVLSYYTKDNGRKSKRVYNKEGFLQGLYSEFYEDGKLKEKGSYFKGRKIGYIIHWYPSGKTQSTLQYFDQQSKISDLEMINYKIINYWDSSGTQVVNNGNGYCACYWQEETQRPIMEKGKVREGLRDSVWFGMIADTILYKEFYNEGVFQTGVRYDQGKGNVYDELETEPEYQGGLQALMEYVGKTLRYPSDARRRGVQGQVYIAFVVDEDGTPHEFEIHKSVDDDLDKEALRVVSGISNWIPGKLRGKPARVKMVLPLRFKLS